MIGFTEQDGVLHADDCPLTELAERFGTPAYIYSAGGIRNSVRALQNAFAATLPASAQPLIAFACKANSNISVLRFLADMGLGADVVSGGELQRALAAGVPPNRIVFSGVGKSEAEIREALLAGIYQLNVESKPELTQIASIAESLDKRAAVALRFNPDVEAGTHAKITTGKEENKFGLLRSEIEDLYIQASTNPWLHVCGLSLHIGSQLTDLEPFRLAFEKLADLARSLKGKGLIVDRLDLGGGLGIVYHDESAPSLDAYAVLVRDIIHPLGTAITLEPGRLLVGASGLLLSKIAYVKNSTARRYVILDAGMNDLMRPTLYDAWHTVQTVETRSGPLTPYDIVGPVCETGDTFALQRPLPDVKEGDLIAILSAGAYGFSMASTYNTRPLPPEILVDGSDAALIRRRQTVEEIIALEMPSALVSSNTEDG